MIKKPTYEELEQRVKELEEESYKHKQTEKLMRGEKEFTAFLIDNAPTFFVAIDHHGKTMMMNQHMLKTLGYTADEVVGKDYLANFVPERDRDMLATVFSRLATEHKHTLNDNYLLSKDGCELLVEWHGTPVFDTNGAFQYFYGIGINITDRKHAEDALRESEERFRELADSLPQIVFETDEKGIITFANRKAFDHFGYTNSELENKLNALQMISPEDRDRAVENIQKVFNGEILGGIEYTALRKNGNTFPVEIHSTAFFQTNKPIGMRGIIIDLSKKKLAEEALLESEEKFRNIAEISLAGIYIIQDGIFMYVNKKFAEIFGYSVEDCLNNMHIRQTVHPEDLDFVREQISKRVSGKVNSVNYTFRGIKKNGKTIHVEIFGSATQLNGKSAVTGTILDITERKRLEEELRKFATIDELTKVWNRRFFLEQADRQVKVQARSRRPLAVLMLDIDLFKKVNDRFGHNIGDDALKTISQACLASLRETDLFGRLGGEEFAALLIDCDHTQAMQAAERMRKAVSIAEVLTPKENLRLTISVGVSSSNYTLDLEKLIKEADQAMYKAKETGRNRVCSFIQ